MIRRTDKRQHGEHGRVAVAVGVEHPPSRPRRLRPAECSASSAGGSVTSSGHAAPASRHQQADLLGADVGPDLAGDAAAVHDRDPVGQARAPRPARSRSARPPRRGRARARSAGGRTPSTRRPGRGSAGRRSAASAAATSRGPARPSAGCRPTASTRPAARSACARRTRLPGRRRWWRSRAGSARSRGRTAAGRRGRGSGSRRSRTTRPARRAAGPRARTRRRDRAPRWCRVR